MIIFFLSAFCAGAQGFQAPSPGKAAVYFVRLSSAGFAISFNFYHNDKFIGDFAGRNYMRYETDPGEHLFWAASENHEFLTADLSEGGTYVVLVAVEMGIAVARVDLSPVTATAKMFEKVQKLVDKKGPKITTEEEINEKNQTRAEYIRESLKDYEEKFKAKRTYHHVSPEMAIPLNL